MAISLQASEPGLAKIDQIRKQKGWAAMDPALLKASRVSEATLKRFRLKRPIQREAFISICEALGLDWREVAEGFEDLSLNASSYYIQLFPFRNSDAYYNLSLSSPPTTAQIPADHWNARFNKLTPEKAADFDSDDFDYPDVVLDLGPQGSGDGTVRLHAKFIQETSAKAVPKDDFAVQAWTRKRFEVGKHYKITSRSTDSTQFRLKNADTEQWIELGEDRGDRGSRALAKTISFSFQVPKSTEYDLYLHCDRLAAGSELNVVLEEEVRATPAADADNSRGILLTPSSNPYQAKQEYSIHEANQERALDKFENKDETLSFPLQIYQKSGGETDLAIQKHDANKVDISEWRSICHAMLIEWTWLTTNPLTRKDGRAFELDQIYVPSMIVERKRRSTCGGNISPEQGSQLYEPTESAVARRFQHDEFFEQVLRQGQSQKSTERLRIAIIGEPGSGKTTLLQKIGGWVFNGTESDVAIWISLADLQGKNLEEYLLQHWLKAAMRVVRVTPDMENALAGLFNSGRVWLLLDGVDEMAVESVNALMAIANQLTGWVAQARVLLTCGLNVWDAGKNPLEGFDTYCNLHFSYGDAQPPDMVEQFIHHWFSDTPELGNQLRAELDLSGRERLKDMVKNPLRLALLCRTWQRWQGRLPDTQAALYQQFVEAFYEWKQDSFPTNFATRRELNEALGQLALRAIAQEKNKFRLRHRLICDVLGGPDAPLFQLALRLGWLNQVGVAAENPDEPVYAFFHPTFQESLAAKALIDLLAALSLGNIDSGNPTAINALVSLLQNSQNESTRELAAWSLGNIDSGNPEAITALVELTVPPWQHHWF